MSISVLKGSLETIALLLFLKTNEFVTSGKIRRNFQNTFSGTLYARLEKLIKQELVEKKVKKGDFAGDDRTEYKLTAKGKSVRAELLKLNLAFLSPIIDKTVNRKVSALKKPETKNAEVKVRDFLMEFSEESSDLLDNKTMVQIHEVLEKLLNSYWIS